ncbi:MAG: DNA polymerase III subunit gamma/tau [Candidatus Lambdaproteobacteria bacterium]|nr:DNA polymerase III subunit gamma/tau [Candidatus Lambdaproteobacteria bacterium]
MDYVVLARKLRPMRFQDLIGQETVARILRNAVLSGRVAHAFLFAGSRGVGKTSAARILTKALNCLQPADGEPCNACANCLEITANASPDIYEIDAASNRGIDNIRELRENTNYRPAKNRYKTYIIDEAHMLTTESFNALLKTLEEPPEQVKFILATTNPHKIPDTIQSRCQRFDFPRIPVRLMSDYLQRVVAGEGLTFSRPALEAIARNAAGGMRDALTAIDQVVSFSGSSPSDEDVLGILGMMDSREVFRLLGALLGGRLDEALAVFGAVLDRGHDPDALLAALLKELKDLSLFAALKRDATYFQDHLPEELEFYGRHAGTVPADALQQLFFLFLDLEAQLKRTTQTRACFEMALAKACRVETLVGVPELLGRVRALLAQGAGAASPGNVPPGGGPSHPARQSAPAAAPVSMRSAPPVQPPPVPPAAPAAIQGAQPRAREPQPSAASAPAHATASGEAGEAADPDPAGPFASGTASAAPAPGEPPAGSREFFDEEPPGAHGEPFDDEPLGDPTPMPDDEPLPEPREFSDPGSFGPPGEIDDDVPPADASPARETPWTPMPPPGAPDAPRAGAPARNGGVPPGRFTAAPPPTGTDQPDEAADTDDPQTLPPLPEHAPCDDARFGAFVALARDINPRFPALLRRMEVAHIGDGQVHLVPPSRAETFSSGELERLRPALHQAFGQAFDLRVIDGTNRQARSEYTLSGRERLARAHHLARERQQAREDAQVRRMAQFFPRATVKTIQLRESAGGEHEDV